MSSFSVFAEASRGQGARFLDLVFCLILLLLWGGLGPVPLMYLLSYPGRVPLLARSSDHLQLSICCGFVFLGLLGLFTDGFSFPLKFLVYS